MHKSIFIRITCKAILILALLYTHSFAGEDVQLIGLDGAILKPSQIASVDIRNTCGDCHDIFELGKSVHFSRTSSNSGANSFECLSCHLGQIASDGKIKKTPRNPDNDSCVSCHSDYEWVVKADKVHAKMSCYDCHHDAGHIDPGPASCSNCHSAKGKGVIPKHSGFTNQHFQKIACETCHIPANQSENGNKELAYSIATDGVAKGIIIPLSGNIKLSHGVSNASATLGKGSSFIKSGCLDCHSFNSSFFFAINEFEKKGKFQKMPNYMAMGYSYKDIKYGIWREALIKPASIWLFLLILLLCVIHYVIFGPRKVDLSCEAPNIIRFNVFERLIHLLAIISFLFLSSTGIAFLLHIESPTSNIRAIHGFVGYLFLISIIGMLAIWWKDALFVSCDRSWVCKIGGYLWIKGECPAEKFNAGQKIFYWLIVISGGLTVSITGFLLNIGYKTSAVFTLHDIAAIALIAGIMGHIYLSVFANPGTITGIITGRVCRAWAKYHHPNWFNSLEKSNNKK